MISPRQYKVVQAECPLCGKVLEGLSEKQWWRGFETHLRLSKNHAMKNTREVARILGTVKPSFRTTTKTKYRMR